MRNYRNSDFAVNKFSEGIVYRFANETVEVSLDDYLSENPERTEKDFHELKKISDEIFMEQDRTENLKTYRNISFEKVEENDLISKQCLLDEYIEKQDKQYSKTALLQLFRSRDLTEKQSERFYSYIFRGLSLREIALEENVTFHAVAQSIWSATKKLKKYFNNF